MSSLTLSLVITEHTFFAGAAISNSNPGRVDGSADSVSSRLVITTLDQAVDSYVLSALGPNCRWTYSSAQQQYLSFCYQSILSPLPLTEHQLCQFASYLAKESCHTDYARHLFPIRAATTTRAHGLNDSMMQMLDRWSSSAYPYIKTPREQLANLSALGQLAKLANLSALGQLPI